MDKLREAIAERIRESGLSIRSIARMCSTSEASIRHFLSGRVKNPRVDTLERVCRACGTTLDTILAEQNRTIAKHRPRKKMTQSASAITQSEKLTRQSSPPKGAENKPGSNIIYNYDGRLFPDEGGDDALLMCHALANTGHAFHGDIDKAQFDNAMREDAEAQVRDLQARLDKAIAARDKLKGEKK